MARRHWLVSVASFVSVIICLVVFYVLYKILKDRVPEFVIYIVAFICLAITFFGNQAIERRIKSWLDQRGDDE
jgi:MFS superfamily sulfate permease-like transporter